MKKSSGKICRIEPTNVKLAEEFPQCAKMMKDTGWFSFFEILSGHNVEVTNTFVKNYSNSFVNFQTLNFKVSEVTITKATCLSIEGE